MDFKEAFMVIPRSFISIICLFIVTKIIGKRQISELSLFDYVIGISIGNFIAEMIVNLDTQFIDGVVAMFVFGIVSYVVNLLTVKSIYLRRFISGMPTIVIDNGKLIEKGLKKSNIDVNDLLSQARLSGYFDISDIECAIMEPNGSISFLPKSSKEPVKIEDSGIKKEKATITANIIIDGKFMDKALDTVKLSKESVLKELKIKGYRNEKEVLLGTFSNNKYNFFKKDIETKNYSLLK